VRALFRLCTCAFVVAGAACDEPAGAAPEGFQYATVATGGEHTCGLVPDGGIFCWGAGMNGELGDGRTTSSATPVRVALNRVAVDVSAGASHACAITLEYELWCWGWNVYGQLGLSGPENQGVPVRVEPERPYASVSAGWYHGCALTPGGEAYCWGRNDQGQLGTGNTIDSPLPVPVSGGLRFAKLSAGAFHTCGLTLEGNAYCWGLNLHGQLGSGSAVSQSIPTAVSWSGQLIDISAGYAHSCAVTANDRAICWGSNVHGELGTGSVAAQGIPGSTVPVEAAVAARLLDISAGVHVTCAATGDRGFCWGRGRFGQLGLGGRLDFARPQAIADFDALFVAFSATGRTHTCALAQGSGVYCWGEGGMGQLGIGRAVALIPARVQGSGRP
jgi:alpha-tubulin suppressor-like RCC1 family protein